MLSSCPWSPELRASCWLRYDHLAHRLSTQSCTALTCSDWLAGIYSIKKLSLQIFWALGTVFEVLLAILVMPTLGWRWLLGLSTIPLFIFAFFSFVSIQLNMLDLRGFWRGSEAALLVKWLKLISLVNLHRYCVNVLLSDYFISSAERKTRLIDHQRCKKYPTVILEQKDHEKSPSWFEKKRVDAAEREDHWLT